MTIINASPDNIIQLGWEGEDRVTVLRVRYGEDWLENGDGVFKVRFLRNGENQAYNSQMVLDDRENHCLLVTLTAVELSKKGTNEMQVVYSGEDFIKKSPVYRYYVSRSVDEPVDPPAQDVYTEIIESLSDLQTDVSGITEDIEQIESSIGALSALTTAKIGDLTELTTTAKTDLVSAINEVNAKEAGGSVTVDSAMSTTSENPLQNKVITQSINLMTLSISGLQSTVESKADSQTVATLSGTVDGLSTDVSGLQTAVQSKADTTYVNTSLSAKADTTYVDTQLSGKAGTAVATTSANGLMSSTDKARLDTVYADYSSALAALGVI